MSETYIPRSLEPVLKKAVSQFPAVVLVGPRQSGKTTLLKHLYGETIPHRFPGASGCTHCCIERSARISQPVSSPSGLR